MAPDEQEAASEAPATGEEQQESGSAPATAVLGTKRGMTQVWREDGERVPVTVVDVSPNTVVGLRTPDKDGYAALKVGMGSIRTKLLNKPRLGQFSKAGVEEPKRYVREVRLPADDLANYSVNDQLDMSGFELGYTVDVVANSKGKGFAGTIKRHGFARGPVTHGSQNVRGPGSIGMCKYPGRVIKGKRMAGRMGGGRVTIKGLEIVSVDQEGNRLLVKGPVPGANGGLLLVRLTGRKSPWLVQKERADKKAAKS